MDDNPRPEHEDDDGRVIASMDVEGMPWHDRRARRKNPQGDPLSDSEARRYTWYAVLAGLVVVGVISLTWVVLTLILTLAWAN